MQLLALSGAQENAPFTGLLQYGAHRLLIDAGVRLDPPAGTPGRPDFSIFDEAPPDAVLLTHAHINHSGSLPLLLEKYPDLPVFATPETIALLRVLFFEGMRSLDRDQLSMEKESFMFRPQWLRQIVGGIRPQPFGEVFHPIKGDDSLGVTYIPAGHLLGAGMILVQAPQGRVLFTGDCALRDQRTIKGIALEDAPQADVMIADGSYGDSIYKTHDEQEKRLIEQVDAVLRQGGRVLFPCFAAGRAQELLLICQQAQFRGALMKAPIYIDGGVRAASDVFVEQRAALHPDFQAYLDGRENSPFQSPEDEILQVHSAAERRRIVRSNNRPAIIFSSSGMLEGGPSPMYAEAMASDRKSAIFLNSHHDDEYPGSTLFRIRQNDTITLNGKRMMLNCHVLHYSYSMHIDAQELRDLVRYVQPQQLILVQSEATDLVRLGRQFPQVDVSVPQNEQWTTLSFERRERVAVASELSGELPAVEEAIADQCPAPDYVPDVKEIYDAVVLQGGMERAWSIPELAANFFKQSYQSSHRKLIKSLMDFCEPYFLRQRHGSDWMYTPQTADVVQRQRKMLESVQQLKRGAVVLVQPLQAEQGPARIGIILKPFESGTITLVAETWKAPKQDWKVVRLIPDILDESLSTTDSVLEFRQALDRWRDQIKDIAIDLLSLWRKSAAAPLSWDQCIAQCTSLEERIALGLELLDHGGLLWETEGVTLIPRPEDALLIEPAILHQHATLFQREAQRIQHADGRTGRLTGRVHWDTAEVLWDANCSFVRQERLSVDENQEPPPAPIEMDEAPATSTKPTTEAATTEAATPKAAAPEAAAPQAATPEAETQSKSTKKPAPAAALDDDDDEDALSTDDDDEFSSLVSKPLPGLQSLSGSALQKLLEEEGILQLRKDIRRMNRGELIERFGSKRSGRIVFARLFRSLVWQAHKWIQKGKEAPIKGGMQTFWYRWCLPALTHAPEYRDMKFEPYDLMCRTFTRMVFELGLFSYADFGFTDLNQRNRLIGDKHPNILVFAEKALWYPLLADLHANAGVSVIAFYGTPSSLTTEYTARELKAACAPDTPLHLIGIVSYSPAGDIAARSFQHQLSCVGFPDTTVTSVIHPQHYTAEELALFRVPIPSRQKTKLSHWLEKTGGIDGEPYGLESESMPESRLIDIVEQQIKALTTNS